MTDNLMDFLNKELCLDSLSEQSRQYFFKVMSDYMSHGRTDEYVCANLSKLLDFFSIIGIGNVESTIILANDPSLLNITDELYQKYVFLGILENEDNTYRYHKLFSKTKDFRVSINKLYARYKLCLKAGYPDINWNILVHSSDKEFAQRFVMGTYRKPYQVFNSCEEVIEWLGAVSMEEVDIEEFKELPVNKELVEKYEKKGRKY